MKNCPILMVHRSEFQ